MVSLVTKHNEYDDIIFQVIKLKVKSNLLNNQD